METAKQRATDIAASTADDDHPQRYYCEQSDEEPSISADLDS
jgi:hypothetical protein